MFKIRLFKLLLSLPIFALGGAISIRSGIGVSAWDTFALGVADVTQIQYGTITMLTGLVVLAIVLIMKQPVGIGTLLDALIIGKLCDLFLSVYRQEHVYTWLFHSQAWFCDEA